MTMSATMQRYLDEQDLSYDVMSHPRSHSSMQTASMAGVDPHRLAKAVILEDEEGTLMAVLPANRHVRLGELRKQLGRSIRLATEDSLSARFSDCELGAVPPIGAAYGLPTIVDDELEDEPEVYMEAGDHQALMRMSHDDFMRLMQPAEHGHFAKPWNDGARGWEPSGPPRPDERCSVGG